MNWRAISNAPGLYGPPDVEDFDTAPYVDRLLASDEFISEAGSDAWPEMVRMYRTGEMAKWRELIRDRAVELVDEAVNAARHGQHTTACESLCRTYEQYDEMRVAREVA